MAKFKEILNMATMSDRLDSNQHVALNKAVYDILIDFQSWKNEVAKNNPMALETDDDDLVLMYMNDFYRTNKQD
jgi:hypothetical protein